MKLSQSIAASVSLLAIVSALSVATPVQANPAANASLNATAANLQTMISSGLSSGQLNTAQAASFRSQLGAITQLQAGFMADGRLTSNELTDLTSRYANLTTQVNAAVQAGAGANIGFPGPGINPNYGGGYGRGFGRGGSWNRTGQYGAQIDALQARVQTKINRGRNSRLLTLNEVRALQRQFDTIAGQEAQMRSRGGIDAREFSILSQRLNQLDSRVDRQMADRQRGGGRWF